LFDQSRLYIYVEKKPLYPSDVVTGDFWVQGQITGFWVFVLKIREFLFSLGPVVSEKKEESGKLTSFSHHDTVKNTVFSKSWHRGILMSRTPKGSIFSNSDEKVVLFWNNAYISSLSVKKRKNKSSLANFEKRTDFYFFSGSCTSIISLFEKSRYVNMRFPGTGEF
jgi:hypothetical protein